MAQTFAELKKNMQNLNLEDEEMQTEELTYIQVKFLALQQEGKLFAQGAEDMDYNNTDETALVNKYDAQRKAQKEAADLKSKQEREAQQAYLDSIGFVPRCKKKLEFK